MDLFPYPRLGERLPERFAWAAASIGIIGLLLLSLIVWVEHFDATAPDVETAAPVREATPRETEPVRTGRGFGRLRPEARHAPRGALSRSSGTLPSAFQMAERESLPSRKLRTQRESWHSEPIWRSRWRAPAVAPPGDIDSHVNPEKLWQDAWKTPPG